MMTTNKISNPPLDEWIAASAQPQHDGETGIRYDVLTGALKPLVRHNQELTIANTLYHPHPAFSPDGQRIVFCRRDDAGRNDVCLIRFEEESETRL